MASALRIVGVFAGLVVLALGVRLVAAHFRISAAERQSEAIAQTLQQSSERMNARVAVQRETERRQKEQAFRAHAGQAALEVERQRLEAETERRKQEAWTAFYRPAKECDRPETWEVQVECGNRHMRVVRAFDAQWTEQDAAAAERAIVIRSE